MKKYIQLQDSYDSKRGDIWEEDTEMGYANKCNGICRVKSTIENNQDWFAPYEEKKQYARGWEELKEISGYYIDRESNMKICYDFPIGDYNKNVYATENQARSALAEAVENGDRNLGFVQKNTDEIDTLINELSTDE